ncbi:hypothetical protein KSP39_PZI006940 [Platanthera zijinensis]|uniref:Uncharacterized protein n=1 Tax=Platanthera zijinensis TaxID=2320716 RepID=A0AAP0BP86_9ASPA
MSPGVDANSGANPSSDAQTTPFFCPNTSPCSSTKANADARSVVNVDSNTKTMAASAAAGLEREELAVINSWALALKDPRVNVECGGGKEENKEDNHCHPAGSSSAA